MAESRISMEEEKLFRIGDVAKMFHISTGTCYVTYFVQLRIAKVNVN